MEDKIKLYIILGVLGLIIISAVAFFYFRSDEDTWIYDVNGVWIKHGSPLRMPSYVLAQQTLIACATNLYKSAPFENFSSQCLGSCDTYAVDIVHVPRTEEDELEDNQCEAFRRGQLKHFIELDKDGNIVRIL